MGDVQQFYIDKGCGPLLCQYFGIPYRWGGQLISQVAFIQTASHTSVLSKPRHGHRLLRPTFLLSQWIGSEYTVIGRVARRIWSVT